MVYCSGSGVGGDGLGTTTHHHLMTNTPPHPLLGRQPYLGIADDLRRDVYLRVRRCGVILPMSALRRVDAASDPKHAVSWT